ncbi:MAG TPA: hypothetical protein VIH68_02520, partial [Bacteroidota bacterium]
MQEGPVEQAPVADAVSDLLLKAFEIYRQLGGGRPYRVAQVPREPLQQSHTFWSVLLILRKEEGSVVT